MIDESKGEKYARVAKQRGAGRGVGLVCERHFRPVTILEIQEAQGTRSSGSEMESMRCRLEDSSWALPWWNSDPRSLCQRSESFKWCSRAGCSSCSRVCQSAEDTNRAESQHCFRCNLLLGPKMGSDSVFHSLGWKRWKGLFARGQKGAFAEFQSHPLEATSSTVDNFVGQVGQVPLSTHGKTRYCSTEKPTHDSSFRRSIRSRCGVVDGSSNWVGCHAAQTP